MVFVSMADVASREEQQIPHYGRDHILGSPVNPSEARNLLLVAAKAALG
jgi:hypothetical protein